MRRMKLDDPPQKIAETKEERFERVAGRRVNAAIKNLRQLRKCAAPYYSSTGAQVESMLQALHNEVEAVRTAFEAIDQAEDPGFRF